MINAANLSLGFTHYQYFLRADFLKILLVQDQVLFYFFSDSCVSEMFVEEERLSTHAVVFKGMFMIKKA